MGIKVFAVLHTGVTRDPVPNRDSLPALFPVVIPQPFISYNTGQAFYTFSLREGVISQRLPIWKPHI